MNKSVEFALKEALAGIQFLDEMGGVEDRHEYIEVLAFLQIEIANRIATCNLLIKEDGA